MDSFGKLANLISINEKFEFVFVFNKNDFNEELVNEKFRNWIGVERLYPPIRRTKVKNKNLKVFRNKDISLFSYIEGEENTISNFVTYCLVLDSRLVSPSDIRCHTTLSKESIMLIYQDLKILLKVVNPIFFYGEFEAFCLLNIDVLEYKDLLEEVSKRNFPICGINKNYDFDKKIFKTKYILKY